MKKREVISGSQSVPEWVKGVAGPPGPPGPPVSYSLSDIKEITKAVHRAFRVQIYKQTT